MHCIALHCTLCLLLSLFSHNIMSSSIKISWNTSLNDEFWCDKLSGTLQRPTLKSFRAAKAITVVVMGYNMHYSLTDATHWRPVDGPRRELQTYVYLAALTVQVHAYLGQPSANTNISPIISQPGNLEINQPFCSPMYLALWPKWLFYKEIVRSTLAMNLEKAEAGTHNLSFPNHSYMARRSREWLDDAALLMLHQASSWLVSLELILIGLPCGSISC